MPAVFADVKPPACLLYLQTSSPLKLWDIYILEDEVVGHDHGKKNQPSIYMEVTSQVCKTDVGSLWATLKPIICITSPALSEPATKGGPDQLWSAG